MQAGWHKVAQPSTRQQNYSFSSASWMLLLFLWSAGVERWTVRKFRANGNNHVTDWIFAHASLLRQWLDPNGIFILVAGAAARASEENAGQR